MRNISTATNTGWIQTYSGKPFWPLDPLADEVHIDDIAWSLSMQCRYAGHTKKFYSVAEHSVYISYAVPSEYALWGLLHDATEAYLTDLPRPVKVHLPEYRQYEDRLMMVIAERFGLSIPEPAIVKEMDTRILFNERAALLSRSVREWALTGEPIPGLTIEGWQPQQAFERFLSRFVEITLHGLTNV